MTNWVRVYYAKGGGRRENRVREELKKKKEGVARSATHCCKGFSFYFSSAFGVF